MSNSLRKVGEFTVEVRWDKREDGTCVATFVGVEMSELIGAHPVYTAIPDVTFATEAEVYALADRILHELAEDQVEAIGAVQEVREEVEDRITARLLAVASDAAYAASSSES